MHTANAAIKEAALGLSVGESTRDIECPFCNGGHSHEHSLSVTRTEQGLLYNCYRASCGEHGFIGSRSSLDYQEKPKEFVPRVFTHDLNRLSHKQVEYLCGRFGLTPEEVLVNGIKFSKELNRFYFPVFNEQGYQVGAIARSYTGAKPKSLAYWFNKTSKLHYPANPWQHKDTVVVVEDIISAIRVARHGPAVALLGTHITAEGILELANKFRGIIFALDPDATAKAIGYTRKYSLLFGNLQATQLSKDPKDMTDEQIVEEIFNGKSATWSSATKS